MAVLTLLHSSNILCLNGRIPTNYAVIGWIIFGLIFLFGLGPMLRIQQERAVIMYEQYRADIRQRESDERTNAQRAASAQIISEQPVDQRSIHLHQHSGQSDAVKLAINKIGKKK